MNYSGRQKQIIWTSPSGKKFILETDGKIKYSRKRKGEVKITLHAATERKITEHLIKL